PPRHPSVVEHAAHALAGPRGGILDESFHRPVLAQPCGERRAVELALLACAHRRHVDHDPIAGAAIERKRAAKAGVDAKPPRALAGAVASGLTFGGGMACRSASVTGGTL